LASGPDGAATGPAPAFDTNDYSLDPALRDRGRVGHRRTGYRHARVFARHRTITELDHARALKAGRSAPVETAVEVRPLARYDALFA
jgi:hypothetical protein